MYALKAFTLLAVAGSAVAAPQAGWKNWGGSGYWRGGNDAPAAATTSDAAVVTAYTTVTYDGNWAGKSTMSASATPVATTAPAKTSAVTTAVASAKPTASSAPSTGGYMDVVSEWRSKMGLSALTEDNTLQGNSLKTVQDGNGQMNHELNPGSMAQVLAPGDADGFEKVFVGGWLCERPDLPGLDGICSTMSAGWSYGGETGHADILSSTSYSKIGCALADGIWGCDLA